MVSIICQQAQLLQQVRLPRDQEEVQQLVSRLRELQPGLAATSAHIALPTTRSGVRGRAKPRRPTTKTAAASRRSSRVWGLAA